ncbi:MAG: histidine phosphatase family protein [Rhizobiales bacterium]|nr:histidine phosphatase family protein [Hyphomicrobiales bacterium]
MRRLILLRHAKSDWPDGIADLERPLAARGRTAAPLVGRYLAREGLLPDRILVSPARRTRETWDLLGAEMAGLPEAASEPRIYEASAARLMSVVREQPDTAHTLLLIGHNPGFEDLADTLVQHGSAAARDAMDEKFPTGAVAVIDLPVDRWVDITPDTGRLDRFITPRMLTGES